VIGLKTRQALQAQNEAFGIWPFSSTSDDPSHDNENGQTLLQAYFDAAFGLPGFTYQSFPEFVSGLEAQVPDFQSNMGELVRINVASTTLGQAQSRLRDLAVKSNGQANVSAITQAVGGSGDTVNWSEGLKVVVSETAGQVADIASTAASGALAAVKTSAGLVKYLPYILGGALLLYGYVMVKQVKIPGMGRR
jgi:hypothetical protein